MSATLLRSAVRPAASARAHRASWALSGILCALLALDAAMKLTANAAAVQGTVQMGWAPHHLPIIGALELLCVVLYLVPRTAPLGAALFTAYFGGAVATHLRLDQPLFSFILAPTYVATILWAALWLRDARVRALLGPTR